MPVIYVDTNDEEAKAMLNKLAEQDMRSASAEVIWLIRQEWSRRYSQPNPAISVADALLAGKELGDGKE
jgi:hypothetical protein